MNTNINLEAYNLPFTLSHPLEGMREAMEHEEWGKTMNHMIDFLEMSVNYASFMFLCILQQEVATSPQLQDALIAFVNKVDNKRPLSFGDWINDLLNPLLLAAHKQKVDHPLVRSFLDNLFDHRSNILLGNKKEASVVQLRNEYRGHSTTRSDAIYHDVCLQLLSRVERMADAFLPLACCEVSIVKGSYTIDFTPIGKSQKIELYPFIYLGEQDHIYLFQSLKDEQTSYISAHENAVTRIGTSMNNAVDLAFQYILPSFDIARELNWNEFRLYMQEESKRFLAQVYAQKKYNQELFVEREQLTSQLHRFWQSEATVYPLLGEAGQGKTNQLCYWTETLIDNDAPVLIFSCSSFAEISLPDAIKQVFGYNYRKDIVRLLDALHDKAEEQHQDIYIFFDALNECLKYRSSAQHEEGVLALYKAICDLLGNPRYTRFKTLLTCRVYTWKNDIQTYTTGWKTKIYQHADDEGEVKRFTEEEIRQAYGIYQQLYQMQTPFSQLDLRVTLRLRDPLILKFASSNFLGKQLSADIRSFSSLSLFEEMLGQISNSYAGHRQCEIIEQMADYILSNYLAGNPIDSISMTELSQARLDERHALHALSKLIYKKDGISIAYAELLNKTDRPTLREVKRTTQQGEEMFVQFIYERFLEYLIGHAFVRKMRSVANRPITAAEFSQAFDVTSSNVVFMEAMRNALLMDCLYWNDFSTLIELQSAYSDDFSIVSLVSETMNMLVRENYEEEVFTLIPQLLEVKDETERLRIDAYNEVVKQIESAHSSEQLITNHKSLQQQLLPVIRRKQLATRTLINGVFLSDYYNENLYSHDVLQLLWLLLSDTLYDIRNDACMYIYYLSKKNYTTDHSPLKSNLTMQIIKEAYDKIRSKSLAANLIPSKQRHSTFSLLETATRLGVLMIIDNIDHNGQIHGDTVSIMRDEITKIFRYFTVNYYLIRIFMPFLQLIMRKQIMFQSDYVNNAMEYQTFWDKNIFQGIEAEGVSWTREKVREIMSFVHHLQRFGRHTEDSLLAEDIHKRDERLKEEQRFRELIPYLISAYRSGDGFSYLVIERIIVIVGTCNWQLVEPLFDSLLADSYRKTNKWFDYTQMSILYDLYQIAYQTQQINYKLLNTYAREATDWTERCRGLFKGHHSATANNSGMYKRNVMCWYAAVYSTYAGDGECLEGDQRPVPAFFSLIDKAIDNKDKELLYHLIDNILELITDLGYIRTSLLLISHIMWRIDSIEKMQQIEQVRLERSGAYQYGMVQLFTNVFSTAKNHFPKEVDAFLRKDIVMLPFPGVSSFREDILNYHPNGERLSDLLTHRFGNFLISSLAHQPKVSDFALEAICSAEKAKNATDWYEQAIRIMIKHMFGKKI